MAQPVSLPSTEERISRLEKRVEELQAELTRLAQPKDWRSTIGMFAGDPVMERIREAGRKIREADRGRAKRSVKHRRAKK